MKDRKLENYLKNIREFLWKIFSLGKSRSTSDPTLLLSTILCLLPEVKTPACFLVLIISTKFTKLTHISQVLSHNYSGNHIAGPSVFWPSSIILT